MGESSWRLVLILGLLSSYGNSGKISLDASGIQDLGNQLKIYTYHVLSYLDHLATNTMKLKLSPKALQKFKFFQNITRTGISFNGLTETPNFEITAEEALRKLQTNLSDDAIYLIKALSSKNLNIPMAFKPTDETLQETMNFLDALKQYWRYIDEVSALEVEEFDPYKIASNLKEIFINRTEYYNMETEKEGRHFLVPDFPLQASEKHIEYLLTNIFIHPRGFESEEGILEKSFIRSFLTKAFEELDLIVLNHEFSVHENDYSYGKEVLGTNIVGLLPGERWGTPEDSPVLIGAHYDTMPNTTGTIDNASGTIAVLEAARILKASRCQFKNSIYFVAFDLEEIGIQGSFMFVKDFLLKILFPTFGIKSFGGALILDCVANWDPNTGAQEVPDTWEEKVHGFKQRMDARQNTGDFVAVIYRRNPDNFLAQKFNYYYCNLNDAKFRLELMPLNELEEPRPNTTVHMENFDFFRSDHYRFWYPSEEAPAISLPALLITDTAPYRGKMKECYHNYCDTVETIKPNVEFLAKIAKAAAWVLADLASGSCGPRGIYSIPEMFLVSKERTQVEKGAHELEKRPSITPEGVMELLKYLGRLKPPEKSISEVELQGLNSPSTLQGAPVHRFSFPWKSSTPTSTKGNSLFNQVTITISGENSTFLIPLKIDYSQQFSKKDAENHKDADTLSSSIIDKHSIRSSELSNELNGKKYFNVTLLESNDAINVNKNNTKINVSSSPGIYQNLGKTSSDNISLNESADTSTEGNIFITPTQAQLNLTQTFEDFSTDSSLLEDAENGTQSYNSTKRQNATRLPSLKEMTQNFSKPSTNENSDISTRPSTSTTTTDGSAFLTSLSWEEKRNSSFSASKEDVEATTVITMLKPVPVR